jgi:hypothetical protein
MRYRESKLERTECNDLQHRMLLAFNEGLRDVAIPPASLSDGLQDQSDFFSSRLASFFRKTAGVHLSPNRTAKRFRKGCWGRGLKRRPLPQTPTLARRCKNVEIKSETGPEVFVTL